MTLLTVELSLRGLEIYSKMLLHNVKVITDERGRGNGDPEMGDGGCREEKFASTKFLPAKNIVPSDTGDRLAALPL